MIKSIVIAVLSIYLFIYLLLMYRWLIKKYRFNRALSLALKAGKNKKAIINAIYVTEFANNECKELVSKLDEFSYCSYLKPEQIKYFLSKNPEYSNYSHSYIRKVHACFVYLKNLNLTK